MKTHELKQSNEDKEAGRRKFYLHNVGFGSAFHVVGWLTEHPEGIAKAPWVTRPDSGFRSFGTIDPHGRTDEVEIEFGPLDARMLYVIEYTDINKNGRQYWLLQPGDGKKQLKVREVSWADQHKAEIAFVDRLDKFFQRVKELQARLQSFEDEQPTTSSTSRGGPMRVLAMTNPCDVLQGLIRDWNVADYNVLHSTNSGKDRERFESLRLNAAIVDHIRECASCKPEAGSGKPL